MPPRHDKNQGLHKYPDGSWGVNCYLQGRRYREKVGTWSEAKARLTRLKASAEDGYTPLKRATSKRLTLDHWMDIYLTTNPGPTDKLFIGQWRDLLGGAFPDQFTLEQLREWCHGRLEAGLALASVLREMSPLQAVYSEIVRAGAMDPQANPFRDRRSLKLPRLNNQRHSYLSLEDQPAVQAALGPTWWPYAEFAILTQMRLSSQAGLQWDSIDWRARVATLERTKNGTKQHVQLSEAAIGLLRQQLARQEAEGKRSPWCWPNSKGGKLNKDHFRQRVWGPAFEQAGLKKMGTGDRNGLTWHDLRHTGPTRLVQAGVDLYTVQHLCNHEDHRTTQRYAHHSNERAREAQEVLARITRGERVGMLSAN